MAKEPWDQITKIYSKAQVFSQCRQWLFATAKERAQVAVESTTTAAEMAGTMPGVAAIGSRQAAELYGLHMLVNWEYYFFIDAQGHSDDAAMKKSIEEAHAHCLQLTVLGSYPRATEVL